MVRYYGFLESGEAPLTGRGGVRHNGDGEKTAMQIRWRGMYQRLLKVDPLEMRPVRKSDAVYRG